MSSRRARGLGGMISSMHGSTTVSNIGVAMFTVADQDAALAFYTEKLGWEVRGDDRFGENGEMRWLEVAPADADVFDPAAYAEETHVTPPEREALRALGLRDVVRERWPDERVFSYWDYRAGMFHKDLGMRIDLVLATQAVADRVKAAWVDRHARKGKGPSDHAPVIVDLDEAPDGDIGPVVPPPSAPAARRRSVKLPQAP